MADGFRLTLNFTPKASGVTRIPKGSPAASSGERRPGGRFANSDQLTGVNRQIAQELQAQVVANIQARIRRRGASTNRLLAVTASPSNITVTPNRIGVGNERYLNNSAAKYWRTIEEGSAEVWRRPFIGTQLYPVGPGKPPFPVARYQTPGLRTFGGEERPWMDGSRYVVKKEIAPMHAYSDAYVSLQPGRVAHQAVKNYLERIGGLPVLDV